MIKEYELTLEDYFFLLEKTEVNDMVLPYNERNVRWVELGKKYNFDPHTVKQKDGSYYKFTARSVE